MKTKLNRMSGFMMKWKVKKICFNVSTGTFLCDPELGIIIDIL